MGEVFCGETSRCFLPKSQDCDWEWPPPSYAGVSVHVDPDPEMFDDEDGLWAGKPKEDPARHPELYDWMTLEPTAAWENYVRPPTVEYDLKNRMTETGSISEC